jgi:hypothetical protein
MDYHGTGALAVFAARSNYNGYGLKDGLDNDVFCKQAFYRRMTASFLWVRWEDWYRFIQTMLTVDSGPPIVLINSFSLLNDTITFDEPVEDIPEIKLKYSDNPLKSVLSV